MFDGFDVPSMGRVLSWVPANPENGDQALWHVHHNDGDEEDLDEAEMKAALRLAAKDPAEHGTGAMLPVAHTCPSGHMLHSSACDSLVRLEYEPGSHGNAAVAPRPLPS